MIESILVANRGEIAARILRTCKRLGVRCIAVHHFEDRGAAYLRDADEVHELIGEPPASAYLDGAQILKIAATAGAQSVHPGYGFLAENAAFADAVQAAGFTFIGPGAETIELMGDKIRARAFAADAGVPVAEGIEFDADQADAAAELGFPLLIKAAAGGGGKGMHIVRDVSELATAARLSASAAERYFADGRIYAERYIERPRARSSAAFRRSSRRRPPRTLIPIWRYASAAPPSPSRAPPNTGTPAPSSSSWHRTGRSISWK
jgi:propionyl-CoA carboxylase alpha chain/3-methylcrotonyl-CoA carboxylase alpha subunit/acetyl-CoA/propionyl-CoA carboxylase biotin carboxyl carrier protein